MKVSYALWMECWQSLRAPTIGYQSSKKIEAKTLKRKKDKTETAVK